MWLFIMLWTHAWLYGVHVYGSGEHSFLRMYVLELRCLAYKLNTCMSGVSYHWQFSSRLLCLHWYRCPRLQPMSDYNSLVVCMFSSLRRTTLPTCGLKRKQPVSDYNLPVVHKFSSLRWRTALPTCGLKLETACFKLQLTCSLHVFQFEVDNIAYLWTETGNSLFQITTHL